MKHFGIQRKQDHQWMCHTNGEIFATPSRAVADAQLEIFHKVNSVNVALDGPHFEIAEFIEQDDAK